MKKNLAAAVGLGLLSASPLVLAQDAAPAIDTGDTAWMLTSTVLVILMSIPGLALFYGGLARSKNMVSVLLQVLSVFSLITFLWVIYGFSLAFGGEGKVFGSFDYVFLKGITPDTISSMLSTIPEFVFVSFQAAFAAITVALVVGSLAERVKFSAVMVFSVIWFTFSYLPMAHMVWGGGLLAEDGALDFAGGTVIHINAGIAGLVGAYVLGKRTGFGKEAFTPHNLTFTMIGACLLWVGWFGFNAGSAGAANGIAGLAFINTIVATSAGVLGWLVVESLIKGKPSLLGGASGAVAGLVGVTPAAGFVGPVGAIIIGALSGAVCVWGVSGLKRLLNVDDSFDVFGIHGVAGIIGAVLTGVFVFPSLGGVGVDDVTMAGQVWIQIKSVLVTVVLSGVVAFIAFMVAKATVGLRVAVDAEREGLDITSHGEKAYNP
ncbi:ammonium transporter [Lampropedia puyangensis]|uniref:Ammonium transporter n=1 Tax=Lampropedia puyangensis TaxID=1330072 RepID=A0A4S8FCY5_9BURK|nr:ammonium transporter [Lampropedia puyangensis]THU04464.1 ammonium transporter [Lampropedia puyangensis]